MKNPSNYWIIEEIKKLEKRTTREGLFKVNSIRKAFKEDPNLALKYLALVAYNSYNRPENPLYTESGIV